MDLTFGAAIELGVRITGDSPVICVNDSRKETRRHKVCPLLDQHRVNKGASAGADHDYKTQNTQSFPNNL